ncbi:MAG: PAS domain S-box protein [Myxococcota bacterium]|nr:PAS domain S-box protein [Myxococcota bacterium]
MSLRTTLLIALAVSLGLVGAVGLGSYWLSRDLEARVDALQSRSGTDLARIDVRQHGLEIEGTWDNAGFFLAREMDVLPRIRRPKLRGPLQAVDPEAGTLRLYGTPIEVEAETEITSATGQAESLADLRPGQRVEISARVSAGRWQARKIKTGGIKASNKIKGTPTRVEIDLDGGFIELHGLRVVLAPASEASADSPLRELRLTSLVVIVLQDLQSAARALVAAPGHTDAATAAADQLAQALEALGYYVDQLEPAPAAAGGGEPPASSLARLGQELNDQAATLRGLVKSDPAAAGRWVEEEIEPQIERRIIPAVYALRGEAEESLNDQIREIGIRASTALSAAMALGGFAVLGVLGLGALLYRAIDTPVRALHDAAVELGHGHLETRVHLRAKGEFGVLAEAFNRMAEELASTTVSVTSLESIFDSMAGILIMLGPDRRILNINRGALEFLGYPHEELVGRPFDQVCARSADASLEKALRRAEEGLATVEELTLVRRNGSAVLVSFSGASVRSAGGAVQGYVCIAQDLTEHKQIEEQVRSSLAEKEILLRELHHRVKNNMQVVSSLLAVQAAYSSDPHTTHELEESQGRIQSMALIHEQLHHSSDLARLDVGAYLDSLAAHLARSFGAPGAIAVSVDLKRPPPDLDQALVCGLIVNELVTNALKHALKHAAGGEGQIHIDLHDEANGGRVLEVRDNGPGMDAAALEEERTLGLTLVTTLAKQLAGRVSVDTRQGTTFRIEFPATEAGQETRG